MPARSAEAIHPMRICLACLVWLLALPVCADTLWLKNGDRLSGTLQSLDGGRLLFETAYAGLLSIRQGQVASLQSERPLLVQLDGEAGELARALRRAGPGEVELVNGATRRVPLSAIRQILPPRPLVEDWRWSGRADLALDHQRADKEVDELELDVQAKARHGRWRHNLSAAYEREFKDGIKSADQLGGEYALDRFFGVRGFWQARLEYERDRVEDLAMQRSLGSGPGYQFWDDALGAFSVVALLNRHDFGFREAGDAHLYALGVKWEFNRFVAGRRVELFSEGELDVPFVPAIDYSLEAALGARYRLNSWVSLQLKGQWDRLRGDLGDHDDTRYSLGFGLAW